MSTVITSLGYETRKNLVRALTARSNWAATASTVVMVLLALVLGGIFLAATGGSPSAALRALVTGSVGSPHSLTNTLLYTAPLLLVAAGSCVCARAGIFNIGQEGQVLMGACFGAWMALRFVIDGPFAAPLVVVGGALGGAFWALLAALMNHLRGVNIVVATLLLNFIATQVVSYTVGQPWLLQQSRSSTGGYVNPQSNMLLDDAKLGSIGEYPDLQLNAGLFIAVILAVLVGAALSRTKWGMRVRMTGLNPLAAKHAGVRVAVLGMGTLLISGAMAGIAGSVLLASPITTNRLDASLSNNLGWDGLLCALVARNRPWLCIPVAFAFGILRAGGDFLSATGIPYYLVDVVKGLLVLALVMPAVATQVPLFRRSKEVVQ